MATATPVNFSASAQIAAGPTHYYGITVTETVGAAAKLEIYDSANSTTAGKPVLAVVTLNGAGANASFAEVADVFAKDGIYLLVVSGAVKGSVRV